MSFIGPKRNPQCVSYREVGEALGLSAYEAMRIGETALARLRKSFRRDQARRLAAREALEDAASFRAKRAMMSTHGNIYFEDVET